MSDVPGRSESLDSWRAHFEAFPFYRFLGIVTEESRAGYARISIANGPNTLGGVGGSVHGGILAALVDVAMLQALVPMFESDDLPGGTMDLGITYLRPALGPRVTAEARVLRKGRQVAVTEVEIKDAEGRLCAKGRTLYSLRHRATENP
jgi:uncharacterized protein (TIGR00369 family)